MVSRPAAEPIVATGALLSTVEIGLGSVLHAWNVPLAGHFLSLNQGFLLCRALLSTRSMALPYQVSNVAAVLKSLSPAGKRLTPMLALSAQGFCFSLGPCLFGINAAGLTMGMILLSLWAFFQPLAIAYLLFGKSLFQALIQIMEAIEKSLGIHVSLTVVGIVVAAKVVAGIAVVVASYQLPETSVSRYVNRMVQIGNHRSSPVPRKGNPAWLALKDLMSPLFLVSITMTAVFFIWADSPQSTLLWGLMRPLALGFLLFYGFRILPLERMVPAGGTLHRAILAVRQL